MAQRCDICGKGPSVGHKISHAHNVSKRRWLPNLASLRAMVGGTVKRLRVCTTGKRQWHQAKHAGDNERIDHRRPLLAHRPIRLFGSL